MAEPTKKAQAIEKAVDALIGQSGGRLTAIRRDKCIPEPMGCGGDAVNFKDARSEREYSISGWCQACQDNFFG